MKTKINFFEVDLCTADQDKQFYTFYPLHGLTFKKCQIFHTPLQLGRGEY